MSQRKFLLALFCLIFSGCDKLSQYLNPRTEHRKPIPKASPLEPLIPDGIYRAIAVRCSSAPVTTGDLSGLSRATITYSGTKMSVVYDLENCKITEDFELTENSVDPGSSQRNGRLQLAGPIRCSDATACLKYAGQIFGAIQCGKPLTSNLGFTIKKSEQNPDMYTLEGYPGAGYCERAQSGKDPLSIDLAPVK